jgi:DNA-binding response OmpR family regulator
MGKILLVEDDPSLNSNIKEALEGELHHVDTAFDGLIAERMLRKQVYDCVILDINLPGKNGYDVCRDMRSQQLKTPVIILTAFDELEDKVKGFDNGADDYLTKPFYMRELSLRVNALLKRADSGNNTAKDIVTHADVLIDKQQKKVLRQGKEISLTPREYAILLRLIEAKGGLVPKKELIQEIWGTSVDVNTNIIEVYINFLRNKVDKPFGKDSMKTRVGYGYFFE